MEEIINLKQIRGNQMDFGPTIHAKIVIHMEKPDTDHTYPFPLCLEPLDRRFYPDDFPCTVKSEEVTCSICKDLMGPVFHLKRAYFRLKGLILEAWGD